MFNYGVYKKQLNLTKSVEKIKKDYIEEREKRREINEKLSQNYKKRIENFVINMLEHPLIVSDYKGVQNVSIRDEEPQKFKGDAQIYVKGFKHEKDRINEALEKNKDLDFLPNNSVAQYQFRMREPQKEIHSDMRFKDKTSLERIESFLKDHTQTQVENMDFSKSKKAFKFDTLSESMSVWEQSYNYSQNSVSRKRAFIARQIAKNLLPSLHQKTHFQAATTLYNNLPLTLNETNQIKQSAKQEDESQKEQKQKIQQNQVGEQEEEEQLKKNVKSKQTKGDQLETFNPIETSKQILNNCNILRKRNNKVKSMSKGEGHLISTLDRSISETYMDLYHIDIAEKTRKNKFKLKKL